MLTPLFHVITKVVRIIKDKIVKMLFFSFLLIRLEGDYAIVISFFSIFVKLPLSHALAKVVKK